MENQDFILIETSFGIIKIPKKAINNDLEDFMESEWYLILDKLYKFHFLTIENEWLKIHLQDEFYGYPEYKIIKLV